MSAGDRVYSITHGTEVEIKSVDFEPNDLDEVQVTYEHNGEEFCESVDEVRKIEKSFLSEDWALLLEDGGIWLIEDPEDYEWIMEYPDIVSAIGFRIFQDISHGYLFIGLNFAKCDFYKLFFTPLYKARGLQWHLDEGLMKQ